MNAAVTDVSARRDPVRKVAHRLGWGVADQAISSLSNFVLGVVVARELGPSGFGAFSLAFVTFAVVISAARGPSTDPLMVRYSGPVSVSWSRAVAAASGTSVALGVACGIGCVIAGLALPASVGPALIGLGIGLPGILLQDSYRFAFFSCGKAQRAVVNDLAWGALQVLAVVGLVAGGRLTPFSAMLVFGLTGTIAGLIGWWQLRIAPNLQRPRAWLVEHRALGGRYLVENLSLGVARQLRLTAVGLVAGLGAVGSIRAAEMLVGPFLILLAGVSQVAVPEAGQELGRSRHSLIRFCAGLSAAQALLVAVWGVVALVVLSRGVGLLLLGDLWAPTEPLLVPTLVFVLLLCVQTSWAAGLRALGAARRSLTAQVSSAVLILLLGASGAWVGDALGSCWGVALATFLGLVVWWWQLRMALREHWS